jgi:hypothetical protein
MGLLYLYLVSYKIADDLFHIRAAAWGCKFGLMK